MRNHPNQKRMNCDCDKILKATNLLLFAFDTFIDSMKIKLSIFFISS